MYSSPNMFRIITLKRMRWVGYLAYVRKRRIHIKIRENRPLRRPRCRWKCNIETDLRDIEWGATDCIYLAQDGTSDRFLLTL
jgi:hypothetical protein